MERVLKAAVLIALVIGVTVGSYMYLAVRDMQMLTPCLLGILAALIGMFVIIVSFDYQDYWK